MQRFSKQASESGSMATIFALGALASAALEAALYLRSGPFGTPFVPDRWTELPLAIFYKWWSLAVFTLPLFVLAWRKGVRRGPGSSAADREKRSMKIRMGLFIALVFAHLVVEHADNETMRFMGIHLSVNYLKTYGNVQRAPAAIGYAVADDPRGAFSAYFLLIIPILFLIIASAIRGRFAIALKKKSARISYVFGAIIFLLLPALSWNTAPKDFPVHARIRPPVILVLDEIGGIFEGARAFDDIGLAVEAYQRMWKRRDTTGRWSFVDPIYPLRKRFEGSCPEGHGKRWNFVLLQLETFRAKDMRLFNPGLGVETTPFLDELARDSRSAYWSRYFANGLPTVYAFTSIHTGLLPHTTKRIATAFVNDNLEAIPQFLAKRGYHSVFFSGPDPDWDNERYWAEKWYDSVVFKQSWGEEDRAIFRDAAQYLKTEGAAEEPFWAAVVSISNHVPFRSPEPSLDISKGGTIIDKLHNTMRYTDDVVREFFESVKSEPWFDRTIFIVTGDHGYDLGDRGWVIGHTNLRFETIWVPLIIHGPHPLLPRGRQIPAGSHIDIAPTVMQLAGVCDDNSFMGHSLIGADADLSAAAAVRDGNFAYQTGRFSSYFPLGASPMLFESDDLLQQKDVHETHPHETDESLSEVETLFEVVDYVLERDLVAPRKP